MDQYIHTIWFDMAGWQTSVEVVSTEGDGQSESRDGPRTAGIGIDLPHLVEWTACKEEVQDNGDEAQKEKHEADVDSDAVSPAKSGLVDMC